MLAQLVYIITFWTIFCSLGSNGLSGVLISTDLTLCLFCNPHAEYVQRFLFGVVKRLLCS